jgi:hypothetical protein
LDGRAPLSRHISSSWGKGLWLGPGNATSRIPLQRIVKLGRIVSEVSFQSSPGCLLVRLWEQVPSVNRSFWQKVAAHGVVSSIVSRNATIDGVLTRKS